MQLQGEIKLQYIVALDICVLRLCAQHDIATSKDGCQDDCPHHFTADLWIMSLYFQMKWKMTAVAQKWGMGYTWQFLLYTSTPRTIIPASSYNPTWWWKEQKSSWIACERTCPHFPCNWLLQRPIDCKYLSICRLIVVPSRTWHCCAYTNWFDLSFLTILIQQKTWYNTHTKKWREGALAQDSLVKLSICHR